MKKRLTDYELLKRKVAGRSERGRPLFKCKKWNCNNLTYGNYCRECFSKGKHKGKPRRK